MNAATRIAEIERLRNIAQNADHDGLARLVPQALALSASDSGEESVDFYPTLVRFLRVGTLQLPAGVDGELARLAASFADRWLSEATVEDFDKACQAHTADVKARLTQSESLQSEVQKLKDLRDTLTRFLELLDVLQPGAAGQK